MRDPDAYAAYTAGVPATVAAFGGRFIVRGGACEALEGEWQPARRVVIEFPSLEQARDWYASAAYREILPIRLANSEGRLAILEGHPG